MEERHVLAISLELLCNIADCSTEMVVRRVNNYLRNPKADKEALEKVKEAYQNMNDRNEFLNSQELSDMLGRLNNLSLIDIHFNQDRDRLNDWKSTLEWIFNEGGVQQKYNCVVPYIPKKTIAEFKEVLNSIQDYAAVAEDKATVYNLYRNLDEYKSLFRDAPRAKDTPTVFRRVLSDKSDYRNLLTSLQFLDSMIESGRNPITWRLL